MFPVCIFGSRSVSKYEVILFIEKRCSFLKDATHIVSGKAKGADTMGEIYADKHGLTILPFPAPWDDVEGKPEHEIDYHPNGRPYWKRAGQDRNEQMYNYILENGGGAIGIWDKCKRLKREGSRGTKNMIELCENLNNFFLYTADDYLDDKENLELRRLTV